MQKINSVIAKYGIWIFLLAAVYRFTFWIIDLVSSFQHLGAGSGIRELFSGLFSMALYLVTLAVLLEVSRKIAEKYTAAELAQPVFPSAPNGYNPAPQNNFNAAPQAPVQPANNAGSNDVWYCSGCGEQNIGSAPFCSKCGKPR